MIRKKEITWKSIEVYILEVLKKNEKKVDSKLVGFVNHYVENAEYEMAFEGLFIEIINTPGIADIDKTKAESIAIFLKLDEESIFDKNFWMKFQNWVKE